MCPSFQDKAICGFIAATDIASKSGYDEWSCDADGYTLTDPCSWTDLTCTGGYVSDIDIFNVQIGGMNLLFILFTNLCSYLLFCCSVLLITLLMYS